MRLIEIKNLYTTRITEIEYLESTGTQYIDTGFVPTVNSKMDIELACTNENPHAKNWTGCVLTGAKGWFAVGAYGADEDNNLVALFAKTERKGVKNFTFDNSFHKYYISNGLQKIDNIESNNTISKFGATMLKVYLFKGNNNWGSKIRCKQKIKYCKIYEGEKLVCDFIPVRIGTRGYMLDKVSGELYGNSGTGDFILGQDVGNGKTLHQIYAKESNNSNSGTETNTGDPEYGGEL